MKTFMIDDSDDDDGRVKMPPGFNPSDDSSDEYVPDTVRMS